jgi:hypothetical protein
MVPPPTHRDGVELVGERNAAPSKWTVQKSFDSAPACSIEQAESSTESQ